MSTDYFSHDTRPEISHPLSRQRSRGGHIPDVPHLASPPSRPTSPPPRTNRTKSGIFALMRRSSAAELEKIPDYDEDEEVDSPAKFKGKGRDRWSKRASRKAPIPPPRERGESEELDWERIRTLPRVRLVPPEDEGEPVLLYPIPHPSSLLPIRARPQSPPTLLAATVAATLITTEPKVASPPPTPPRQTSPPSGVALNSLAHATSIAQDHGHWIGMSDKFILPPPIFSRGPTSFGRPAATRGIIMPKTRRQVEADMGRRMSMVEQRKRDSLELERFTLLPPLEEAAQSPPNVMMPPVDEMDNEQENGREAPGEDEDELPLGRIKVRARPSSPPDRETYEAMMNIHSIAPFDLNMPNEEPNPVKSLVLGPAFELKPTPSKASKVARPESPPIPETPLTLVAHIRPPPPIHAISLPTPPPPPPPAPIAQPIPPVTRPKRSKSLTAVLSRSSSDDGPPRALPLPPIPPLKRQKSLKKLFFSSATEAPPPLPVVPDLPPSPRTTTQPQTDFQLDQPEASTSKKGKSSRTKAKPPLRIETQAPHPTLAEDPKSGYITPGLGTASSSTHSEAYPLTPGARPDASPAEAQSAGGIRGLSKRFSLSNMSGAFRKKSSISGMIPVPSEAEVPMVPDLPAVYKKSAAAAKGKSRWKGKEKEVAVEDIAVPELEQELVDPAPESSRSSIRSERRISIESTVEDEREESHGSPIAGPSRTSSEVDYPTPVANLIGLSSLGTEPFDILDSDYEFPPTSPSVSPAPAVDEHTVSTSLTQSKSFENDHFHDPDTSSISSCCSLDEEEQPSIVHAQLMQVSPTTRRNSGVSLQEFLGTAPLPQTGVLVARPNEKRMSVEGIIMGPLLIAESPIQGATVSPNQESEGQKRADGKTEKAGKSKRPISIPPPLIDLRGQYLKGIGPSGSRGAQQLLNMTLGSLPPSPVSPISPNTILAPAAPIQSPPAPPIPEPTNPSSEDTPSESSTEQETEDVPATPCLEELERTLLSGRLPHQPCIRDLEDSSTDTSQSSSVDSGLIIVEAPPPPSPPLLPVEISTRNASRASTPRSRFTTPEALLRLLTSPLAGSRLSRSHPTPGSNGSSKSKKGVAVGVEGLPIPMREDGEVNWSTLLAGTQLDSLHFDSLGLDISFGSEKEGIAVAI